MPLLLIMGLLVAVPLAGASDWQVLSYRGIPPNAVTFGAEGLTIGVDRSASPVIHALVKPMRVVGLRAHGRLTGRLESTPDRQGLAGYDDFALRIGLVEAGSQRPSFIQRRLAAPWIRQLFALAPPGAGIEQIRFFNVGVAASQIGWTRRHPLSDLMVEEVVTVPDAAGRFQMDLTLAPIETVAVWLAADGDDTASRFSVRLESLALMSDAR